MRLDGSNEISDIFFSLLQTKMAVSLQIWMRILVAVIITFFAAFMLYPVMLPQKFEHKRIPTTKYDEMMNDETNLWIKPFTPPRPMMDKKMSTNMKSALNNRTYYMAGGAKHTDVPKNENNSVSVQSQNSKVRNNDTISGIKKIVLWNKFFGRGNWYMEFPKNGKKEILCSNRNKCVLSINRKSPLDYDAVVFHTRDPNHPPKERNPSQIYIAFVYEAPVFRGRSYMKGNFYNWSATYYKKSDVTLQHGRWETLSKPLPNAIQSLPQYNKSRPNGTSTILWVVSHCGAISGQDKYVKELQRHMKVDIYGRCGKRCPGRTRGNNVNCYDKLAKTGQYKFYLAFENSNCEDYISKKPYRGIAAKMVPIVYGGKSAKDYVGLFPPNAYIDTRNFTSPKQLAEHLKVLDRDDDKYFAYHAWRTDYQTFEGFGPSYCQICDALHNSTLAYPRTINWEKFWNPWKMCDFKLLGKLLG